MNFNHKKGFTLLELIVVIIIVGVLVSLALPRFFKLIKRSYSAEALVNMGTIRQAMERCYTMSLAGGNGTLGACRLNVPILGPGPLGTTIILAPAANTLNIDDPDNSPNAHFQYIASYGQLFGHLTMQVQATSLADPADTITMGQRDDTSMVVISGAGVFTGIQ